MSTTISDGRGRRIRTRDPRFWRPVLYQLSYTPVQQVILYHTSLKIARGFAKKVLLFFGFFCLFQASSTVTIFLGGISMTSLPSARVRSD